LGEVLDLLDDLTDLVTVCDCPYMQEVLEDGINRFRHKNPTREDLDNKDFKGVAAFESRKKVVDWTGQTLIALKRLMRKDLVFVDKINYILECYAPDGWSDTELSDSDSSSSYGDADDGVEISEQDSQTPNQELPEQDELASPQEEEDKPASQETSPPPSTITVGEATVTLVTADSKKPYTLDEAKGRMVLNCSDPDAIDWEDIVSTLIKLGEGPGGAEEEIFKN